MSTEYKPLRIPLITLALTTAAFGVYSWRTAAAAAPAFVLFEKVQFQALRDLRGVTVRLLEDKDGDRRAETVVIFDALGRPVRAEVDFDHDGVVERWETLRPNGTAERIARARKGHGPADMWEYIDLAGRPYRRDFDEDGDGRPDHVLLLGPHGETLHEERSSRTP